MVSFLFYGFMIEIFQVPSLILPNLICIHYIFSGIFLPLPHDLPVKIPIQIVYQKD